MPYSNILIPVDGSEYSTLACRIASGLTKAIAGKETLHLLYCIVPVPHLIGGDQRDSVMKEEKENAEKIFARARKILEETGNNFVTHIRQGYAGRIIVDMARELRCGMIIMGTRGVSDLKGTVLGSVSHDVLQHAAVPVLLVNNRVAAQDWK